MSKQRWISLFLLAALPLCAQITRLPDEFTITERVFSLPATFDLETELGPFAKARKRFFSLTTTFDIEDANQNPIASARARFFAWTTVADVLDGAGAKIGWLEEEYFKIIPWAEYRVYNCQDQLTALARMNFWGTKFRIYHPDRPDEIYAVISRPFIRLFRDRWTVRIFNTEIFESGRIDPRLLMMLAVYQTDKDERDKLRGEIFDQLLREAEEFGGTRSKRTYSQNHIEEDIKEYNDFYYQLN